MCLPASPARPAPACNSTGPSRPTPTCRPASGWPTPARPTSCRPTENCTCGPAPRGRPSRTVPTSAARLASRAAGSPREASVSSAANCGSPCPTAPSTKPPSRRSSRPSTPQRPLPGPRPRRTPRDSRPKLRHRPRARPRRRPPRNGRRRRPPGPVPRPRATPQQSQRRPPTTVPTRPRHRRPTRRPPRRTRRARQPLRPHPPARRTPARPTPTPRVRQPSSREPQPRPPALMPPRPPAMRRRRPPMPRTRRPQQRRAQPRPPTSWPPASRTPPTPRRAASSSPVISQAPGTRRPCRRSPRRPTSSTGRCRPRRSRRALVVPHPVADTAGRLALTDVQPGDIAIQSGNPGRGTYMLMDDDPSDPGSWVLQVAPTDAVSSVNGYQGIVVLGKGDVGLGNVDNTSDANKPISGPQSDALATKVDKRTGMNVVYTNGADGNPSGQNFTSAATNFTIPIRNGAGQFLVGTPTDPAHPATKGYTDTALSGKAAAAHTHGAADIASGTLDVARLPVGTSGTTVAAGNDSRIVNAVPNTRTVTAGTGLSGGGTLDVNRTLSVLYGNTANTAAQGNDLRLSDTRTPTDNTVSTAKIQDGAVTLAKLATAVSVSIQQMIDVSVLAAQLVTINAQAGAYTLVATDANKAVEVTSASAVNITIPTDTVNFPIGTVIEVDQIGAGKVSIVGASGVTVQAAVTTPTTRAQFSALVLRKRAANLWLVTGDLA
ncbi:minor tail protein [Gordonia phage Sahara]|uniref:Minor tail protein n=1 Tax=Gordonia phage Sahara TaxID=2859488 RepID=A0AAE7WMN9_9CAUD|nr:tail protein [Gordonia phage Sahara]QYW00800.1 minor tail protein [Gordonia phage Sahara]